MDKPKTDRVIDYALDAMNRRISGLGVAGLSVEVVDFDSLPDQRIRYTLYVRGEVKGHPTGPDPDGDGLDYHYVPVDQTTDITLHAGADLEELAQASELAMIDIANGVLEGRDIIETQLSLTYQLDHA